MYTCVTCGLQFDGLESQKSHMKSDWHRYNLKRRVAQLPAIDEETFVSKIAALTANNTDTASKASDSSQTNKRELRRQKKDALEARKRELLAARDALQAKAASSQAVSEAASEQSTDAESQKPSEESQVEEEELEEALIAKRIANKTEIPSTTCLFCPMKANKSFETVEENVEHMFKLHGLYIPERKYLTSLDGLIGYLGEKIGLGNCCLVCSYQGRNVEAVREHMLRKRHMRIPYELEAEKLEISDFYDFTTTYDNVNSNAEVDGDEWEDVSGEDDDGNDEEEDFEEDNGHYMESETSLHLASGAVIGHRLLAKYYRQNMKPERVLTEGQGTVTAAETRHFISATNKLSLAESKRVWLQEKKHEDRDDRRAAKFINNQPHFRDPLLQ
ncbi:hypothetical protein PUMCH_000776 [Australozyma saopauloensis]|uniref:C2H2-type domain-containing protein n=1 Tax=Australozyma saopauloensis TaxID=291208 RepID=A0AAX4H6Z2_9ASCO|nr:hypothetical protein PUMCH_000776 [[Candida] saopauloensis]